MPGRQGIVNEALKFLKIGKIAFATGSSHAEESLRPGAFCFLPDFDVAGAEQRIKMAVYVAIGHGTLLLDVVEEQSLRLGHQAGHDGKARLLVQEPVEAIVSKPARTFACRGC